MENVSSWTVARRLGCRQADLARSLVCCKQGQVVAALVHVVREKRLCARSSLVRAVFGASACSRGPFTAGRFPLPQEPAAAVMPCEPPSPSPLLPLGQNSLSIAASFFSK